MSLVNLKGDFFKRMVSALVLAPIVLLAIYLGGYFFTGMIIIACVFMSLEWSKMVNSASGIVFKRWHKFGWQVLGFFYVFLPCSAMVYLRELPNGFEVTLWLFLAVWATDIGAYIVGTIVGGPKICPRISPKKTWSGLIGGMLSAAAVSHMFELYGYTASFNFTYTSFAIAFISQFGDFLESGVKRYFKLKDSGNLIPGHGGILDRVDGLITSSVFVLIVQVIG